MSAWLRGTLIDIGLAKETAEATRAQACEAVDTVDARAAVCTGGRCALIDVRLAKLTAEAGGAQARVRARTGAVNTRAARRTRRRRAFCKQTKPHSTEKGHSGSRCTRRTVTAKRTGGSGSGHECSCRGEESAGDGGREGAHHRYRSHTNFRCSQRGNCTRMMRRHPHSCQPTCRAVRRTLHTTTAQHSHPISQQQTAGMSARQRIPCQSGCAHQWRRRSVPSMSVWQKRPLRPAMQRHVTLPTPSMHVPPDMQGEEAHSAKTAERPTDTEPVSERIRTKSERTAAVRESVPSISVSHRPPL